ncbi:MAG: hypothetical protein GY827_12600 [Cytophagales bacterium]|nr:hypothetical protein [Cytophagales bacterium]
MKQLFLIIISLCFSVPTIAQCDGFEKVLPQEVKGIDFSTRFPNAQKVVWKTCRFDSIYYASFIQNDTSYSVVYNYDKKWLGTERRLLKKVKAYDWKKEKFLNKMVALPSPHIFSQQIIESIYSIEYNVRASEFLDAKTAKDYKAMLDFYIIELPKSHSLSEIFETTTFYVMDLGGIELVYAEEQTVLEEYYNFYSEIDESEE